MADDYSGLLGGFDPSQLQGLLAQFQPSDEDKQRARRQAALAAAGALFSNMYKPLGIGLGAGITGAANTYDTELKNLQAQRGQNVQASMQVANMARQMQMQKQMGDLIARMNGGQTQQTQAGPPAPFQQPGGAAASVNAATGGTAPAPVSLPTQQPVSASPPDFRAQLAQLNLMSNASGGKDYSPAIKLMYPDIIPMRPGASGYNPATGQFTRTIPVAPPGYYYDPNSNEFAPVKGGTEAQLKEAAIPRAAAAAYTEQEGVLPGGGTGVVGSKLSALGYDRNNLPFITQTQPSQLPQRAPIDNTVNATPAERAWMMNDAAQSGLPPPLPAAPPQRGVQTKLAPGIETEQRGSGEIFAKQAEKIDVNAEDAMQMNGRIRNMRGLLSQFGPNMAAPTRQKLGEAALAFGTPSEIANRLAGGDVSAMQEFGKQALQTAFETTRQQMGQGSRIAQQEILLQVQANPSVKMTPQAINAILDYNEGVNNYKMAKQAFKEAYTNANGTWKGGEAAFNKAHPVGEFLPPVDTLKSAFGMQQAGAKGAPNAQQIADELRRRGVIK